jgi:hypothetical protein
MWPPFTDSSFKTDDESWASPSCQTPCAAGMAAGFGEGDRAPSGQRTLRRSHRHQPSGKDRSGRRFIPGSSRPDRVLRGMTPGAGHPRDRRCSPLTSSRLARVSRLGRRARRSGSDATNCAAGTLVCAVRGSQGFVIRSATVGSELACAGTVRSAAQCSFNSWTSAAALEPRRDVFQGRAY